MTPNSTTGRERPAPTEVRRVAEAMAPAVTGLARTPPPPSLVEAAARVLLTGDEPVRSAFLARALNALARVAPDLGDRELSDAVGAGSDYAVLLRALEEPDALAALRGDDPLGPARLRGLRARLQLLEAQGGTLSAEQVAGVLGVTRQAVDKRRRIGRLIALQTGRRGYAYPAWQFDANGGTLSGLESVLGELRAHDPWMRIAFFLNDNSWLGGRTPLAELRRGQVDAVRRAARAYGEQGAA